MINLPNFLSLLRIPLALCFIPSNMALRTFAILFAAATDFFDGFFARKYRVISSVGTIIDPLTDKFFVFVALATLLTEQRITPLEILTLLCRDFSIILFGIYLSLRGKLADWKFRSIISGKITTTLQLTILLLLTFGVQIPSQVYYLFVLVGIAAFGELYYNRSWKSNREKRVLQP